MRSSPPWKRSAADDRRRPQGPRGPQGPCAAHRARRRHRRLDGRRHIHPHRHNAEVVQRPLHRGSGATIPASTLDKVRALPQVDSAGGDVAPAEANVADIIGKDGKAVAEESLGGSYDAANARFSPYKFKTGEPPQGAGEVAIDAGTAKKHHYAVGDTIVVSTLGKKHPYKISGTVSFGSIDSLGFASIAAWDVPTAQSLLNREGSFDAISVAAKDGTSPAQLVKAIKPLLSKDLQVKD